MAFLPRLFWCVQLLPLLRAGGARSCYAPVARLRGIYARYEPHLAPSSAAPSRAPRVPSAAPRASSFVAMQLATGIFLLCAMRAAADYLELKAFASKKCEGAPLLYVAKDMGKVECVNSTSWDPSGADEGFICDAPTFKSPYGSSSSYLCLKGEYNYTKPLKGAVFSFLPSRAKCNQRPSMIHQYLQPGACILAGLTGGVQLTCDSSGVTFSAFNNAKCTGAPDRIEKSSYGCNLTSAMAAENVECSGY